MKITGVTTYLVGNRWKNWLFVRVDTDEGIHGLGEGSLNGFCRTVEAAVHELEALVVGHDPFAVESLGQRLGRDLYSEGGQIHGAAMAAIEVACWDIKGKALGVPLYELLGGLVRDRVPVYANGWYQVAPNPGSLRRRGGRRDPPWLLGDEVRPVRDGVAHPDPTSTRRGDRHRRRRARRSRSRRRPHDRGSQPLRAIDRPHHRRTTGAVPAGLVRGARPAPAHRGDGPRRPQRRGADRHRRVAVVDPTVRRTAVAPRRGHPPTRTAQPRWSRTDEGRRRDGRGALRHAGAAQRPRPGVLHAQPAPRSEHAELLLPRVVRGLQRTLDTADRRGRSLRRHRWTRPGQPQTGPRDRPRLGSSGRPSVRGESRPAAVRTWMGAA